jgi:thioredoxin 1
MPTFDTPLISNDQSLDRVLAAGVPVVLVFVDVAPAPHLSAAMNQLAKEHAGDLLVVKINTRENPNAVGGYGIARPPALITFKAGQVLAKAESISVTDLEKHVAYLLGKGPRPETPPASSQQSRAYASKPASDGHPHTVTDANFEREVIKADRPVLVDFWAPWCGPCRMTEPIIEKIATEMVGRLKVAKVNVDENPFTAQKYGVQSIPTMMIVKNGQIVDRWAGALPEPAMRSRVNAKI